MQEVHLAWLLLAIIESSKVLSMPMSGSKQLARNSREVAYLRRFCGDSAADSAPRSDCSMYPKMYLFQVIGHLSKGQLLISCKIITGSAPHSFSATMPHPTNQNTVDDSKVYGDWRDELFQNGYVVIKNAIPKERCNHYIEKMFQWLESFPFGFDRNDRSTWTDRHLPEHIKGGMYHGYRVQHERFMWEARSWVFKH